ncbi:MAG: L,D-transpeptidase family protein [Candidatus Coprovivens sp.]
MKRKTKFKLIAGVLASSLFISGCKLDYNYIIKSAKADVKKNPNTSTSTPDRIELDETDLKNLEETLPNIEISISETLNEHQEEATPSEETLESEKIEEQETIPIEYTYQCDVTYMEKETELKAGPSSVYPTIRKLEINEEAIKIFTAKNGWDLIKTKDYVGYIKNEAISYQTEERTTKEKYTLTEQKDIVVTTSMLNFRMAPTVESNIIKTFNIDTELEVIATVDNGWLAVRYNGQVGFVHGGYTISMLDIANSLYPELELDEIDIKKIVYSTTSLNLRCGSSTDFESLLMLEKYETLRVIGEYDNWYFVLTNERNFGFVSKEYTKELDEKCIVVDKSCQQLYYYHRNKLIYTTEVTTGKDSTPSDTGLFRIWRKDADTYLTDNKTYNSHVDYCLYYNGGEAIHDADWRYTYEVPNVPESKRFGSELYHTYGSHGCINTPHDIAGKLFEESETGDKVLVHK